MRNNFQDRLSELEDDILKMGEVIDALFADLLSSIQNKNLSKEKVLNLIEQEMILDKLEFSIETKCTEIIALFQPVGIDLRFLICVLKISSDLERIGDHLRKIIRKARKVIELQDYEHFNILAKMIIILRQMNENIIIAFKEKNLELTKRTLKMDAEIDELQKELFQKFIEKMNKKSNAQTISLEIYLLFMTRFLERIGDHVENIGERIIFLVTGVLKKTTH